MKRMMILFLFLIGSSEILSQGMFTQKGRFSLDAGIGYISNDKYDGLVYNISTSILGVIDLGANYFKAFPSNTFKRAEGNTAYLNFYVKKDSSYGIVLNTAFGTVNNESSFLAGLSFYGRFVSTNGFPLNIFPYLSIGYLTTEDVAVGLGLAIEKYFNKNYSIVITPAINASNSIQLVLGLEFIIK